MKRMPLAIAAVAFFLMGNTWTFLPATSNLLLNSPVYSLTTGEYGLLSFFLLIGALAFSSVSGLIGYKKGMKLVILIGIICVALANGSYFLAAQGQTFLFLLFGQILFGLGIGALLTSVMSYLSFLMPQMTPISLTGICTCINLGSFSYPLILDLVFKNNWQIYSLFIMSVYVILFVLSIFKLPDIYNPHLPGKPSAWQAFGLLHKRFYLFLSVIFLYAICENTFSSWSVIFLRQVKEFDINPINFGLSIFWASVGLGQFAIFWLLRWINPQFIYRNQPLLVLIGLYGIYFSSHYPLTLLFFILAGLGCSAFFALTMSFVESENRPSGELAAGLIVAFYFLGGGFGSLLFGGLSQFGLGHIFPGIGLAALIVYFIIQGLMRKANP